MLNNNNNNNNNNNINTNDDSTNNKYNLVLKDWTGSGSGRINAYLRNGTIPQFTTEKDLKSNIWCLHKAN